MERPFGKKESGQVPYLADKGLTVSWERDTQLWYKHDYQWMYRR